MRRIRDERGVSILFIEHVIRLVMDVSDRGAYPGKDLYAPRSPSTLTS